MKEFIAKLGYTMMWAFGIPEYTFEEAFEGYYRVGIVFISLVVICILVFVSVGIGELIEWRKKRNDK